MDRTRPLPLLVAAVFLGCHGAEPASAPTVTIQAPDPAPAPDPAATEAPVAPKATPKAPPARGDDAGSIGVPECDAYIARYEGCIAKVLAMRVGGPPMDAAQSALTAQREAFKQAASTPEGRDALKSACRQVLDALEQNPVCK